MAGQTIGEVNINLRLSLAQFKQDVKSGTQEAGNATKRMAQDMKSNVMEARGTLSLLGEEIGVQIPRHLQTMIAKIPGVGSALTAAFSSVAVLALIEVIVQVIQKIEEFRAHAEKVQESLKKFGVAGSDALRKLDEETLQLNAQLDLLQGDTLGALRNQIKLINEQSLDKLTDSFRTMAETAQKALDDIQQGWTLTVLGFSNHFEVSNVKEDLKGVLDRVNEIKARNGDLSEIATVYRNALLQVNAQLADSANLTKDGVQALKTERDLLENQLQQYTRINQNKDKQTEIAQLTERNRLETEYAAQLDKDIEGNKQVQQIVSAAMQSVQTDLEKQVDAITRQIEKLQEYKNAWEAAHGGIDAVANQAIERLNAQRQVIESVIDAQKRLLAAGVVPGVEQKFPNLNTPDQTKPSYGGTKEAMELYKIQTESNAANEAAAKIYSQTRTASEQYATELTVLNELLKQGKIDQDTYMRAVAEAKTRLDTNTIAMKQFGEAVGQDITQAAIFGSSWSDAFKAILIELIKVIAQMTVLKTLQQSAAAGGGGGFGGFLSSFIGGLFGGHRASGGATEVGKFYQVGENGPEWFAPGMSGTIIPNGAAGGSPTVIYQIDARGAQPGVEARIKQALKETEDRAVARAVVTTRELGKRR